MDIREAWGLAGKRLRITFTDGQVIVGGFTPESDSYDFAYLVNDEHAYGVRLDEIEKWEVVQ